MNIIATEIGLFVWGFVYGLLLGDPKMHWLVRSLAGAAFFAFFYIAIPIVCLQEYLESRRPG